ncbi:PucR family transcriptional regulator [Paenibacillus sp. CMAA1364]
MMSMETLRQRLEQIVGIPLRIKELNKEDTKSFFNYKNSTLMDSVVNEGEVWFPLYTISGRMSVLAGELNALSLEEVQFMELILANMRDQSQSLISPEEEEKIDINNLSAWIQTHIDSGQLDISVPEHFMIQKQMIPGMVPFLLISEGALGSQIPYIQLKKLLVNYFDGAILLIPLKNDEWLILAQLNLVMGNPDEKEEELEETEAETLTAFCDGLHELVSNECVGAFHLSVALSLDPRISLPAIVVMLRETIVLGKAFHITEHIHLPWDLVLERLVFSIPDNQRSRFLEHVGDHSIFLTDTETLLTLDTFFQLDCNVSETAKRMYIHRNTLLYRLDKIKQETGLDVRSFGDAVLIKLTMLLYKMTKRK